MFDFNNPNIRKVFQEFEQSKELKIQDVLKGIEFPFEIKFQKLGSTKEEILENLENKGIEPYSIPFIKYSSKDNSFYLIYHAVNYDKFTKQYKSIGKYFDEENLHIDIENGNRYIKTLDEEFQDYIKNLLIEYIGNRENKSIELINYTTKPVKNKDFLGVAKLLSDYGFSLLPLNSQTISKEKSLILAIIPDTIVEFPNLFSIEHEIDVKDKKDSIKLFNDIVLNGNPISLLIKGEYETIDSSLDEETGHEFVIGGHLLPNLIWKSTNFMKELENKGLLFERYLKNHEDWKEYYGMHISTSVPSLFNTRNLYVFLHNIGIIYDLLTRHKNRLYNSANLSANSYSEFISGLRGIFRFVNNPNIENYIFVNVKNIVNEIESLPETLKKELFLDPLSKEHNNNVIVQELNKLTENSKTPFEDFITKFLNLYTSTINLRSLSTDMTMGFLEFIPANIHRYKDILTDENIKLLKNISKRILNNDTYYTKLSHFLNILKKLEQGKINSQEFENLIREKYDDGIELVNIFDDIYDYFERLMKSINENIPLLGMYISSKSLSLENNENIPITVNQYEDLKVYLEHIRNKYSDNETIEKFIENIKNSISDKTKSSEILANRLEIRFPQTGYTLDYIINNLIFIAKMTKDLFKFNYNLLDKDLFENVKASPWSSRFRIREYWRAKVKSDKKLKEFFLKRILGFNNSEITLFNKYFNKYC
jgi:hypothetical protein